MATVGAEQIAWMRGRAPDDVVATTDWLLASGFVATGGWGGGEGSGDVQVILGWDGWAVELLGERGRWFLTFALPTGHRASLKGVLAVMDPDRAEGPDGAGVEQVPSGVVWREQVPRCLAWLQESDRTERLKSREEAYWLPDVRARRRRPPPR